MSDSVDDNPPAEAEEQAEEHQRESHEATSPKESPQHVIVDRPHGFFGRWLRRIVAALAVLVILLLLGFVAISVVLQTSLPRTIASEVATSVAGLDVRIGDLDVGWGGGITLTDLEVRLPGEADEEGPLVLELPRLYAKIPALPVTGLQVAIGVSPQPSRVEVDQPVVYMTETAADEWTVLQALEIVSASFATAPDPDAPAEAIALPPLPELVLNGGTVIFRDADDLERRLESLDVAGAALSPLVYGLEVRTGGELITLDARLTPHTGRTQQAQLVVTAGLAKAIEPFLALPELAATIDWTGSFTSDGGIEGVVTFNEATHVADIAARGELAVRLLPDGVIELNPADVTDGSERRLRLANVPGLPGEVGVIAGSIRLTPDAAIVDGLLLDAADGNVLLDEIVYDLNQETATVSVAFQNLQPAEDAAVDGSFTADLWYGQFGEPRAKAALTVSGEASGRSFDSVSAGVEVTGYNFKDFRTLDIEIGVPEGILTRDAAGIEFPVPPVTALAKVRLDAARKEVDDPYIELARLDTAGGSGTLAAEGRYYMPQPESDDESKHAANYGLWLSAEGWDVQLPRMPEPLKLSFGVVLEGQVEEESVKPIEIASFYGRYADIDLFGEGWFLPEATGDTPPLSMELTLLRRELGADVATDVPLGEEAFVDIGDLGTSTKQEVERDDTPLLAGDLSAYLSIWGGIETLDLEVQGELSASGFAIGPYEIGDARTTLDARVTDEVLTVAATGEDFFDAQLDLMVDVPYDEELPGIVRLKLDAMSVTRLGEVAALEIGGAPPSGIVDVDMEVKLNGFAADRIRAGGTITIRDLSVAYATLADTIVLRPLYVGNRITLPIEASRVPPPGVRSTEELAEILPDEALDLEEPAVQLDRLPARTLSLQLGYDLTRPDEVLISNLKADAFPIVPDPESLGTEVVGVTLLSLDADRLLVSLGGAGAEPGNDPEGGVESPMTIEGSLWAAVEVLTGPTPTDLAPLMNAELLATADKSRVTLDKLIGTLPGIGGLRGGGTLQLADLPGQSTLWIDIDAKLKPFAERLGLPEGGEGELDVALSVSPAPGPRPKGEVLLDLAFAGRKARWRTIDIDRGQVLTYLSRADRIDGSPAEGQYDFTILSTERIRILAAGGTIEGYVKYRDRRTADDEGLLTGDRFVQGTIDGQGLNVAQIAPLLERDAEGILDFGAELFGPVGPMSQEESARVVGRDDDEASALLGRFNAAGFARIRDGRLATVDLFRVILEGANLLQLPARDRLDVEFRLEAGTLFVSPFIAFVDGIEIRGNVQLQKLFSPTISPPISGAVIVLAKPLSAINLPFFEQAQEVLDAIQANATALRLGGTIDEPSATPGLLSDFGSTLGALLGR